MKSQILKKLPILLMGMLLCLPAAVIAEERAVIVGFHEKPGHLEKELIREAKGRIKRSYRVIPAMAVTISEEDIEKVRKNPKVAYVEDDAIYTAVEPLIGDEYINSWGVQHIGADVAHASGNKGAGVRVAVLDSGIDYTHPDLDDNFQGGIDFVFNDDDPFDDNFQSHGTHIAGIIAAEENGIGVIGVVPEADLYAVKVLDGGGFGLESWIIAGIEWSIENGIDVINLSLEGPDREGLQAACDKANDSGIVVVAAGGNTFGREVLYPAAYDSVIAVTGTSADDVRANFSPIGPEVELAAPGVGILSTCSLTEDRDCEGGYRFLNGTSQAAPHVAGTAALLISSGLSDENGNERVNDEVREKLHDTALDLGEEPGRDDVYGFGLVDAAAATLPADILFTILRGYSSPHLDAETVPLEGMLYEITIVNNNLSKVDVDVFESGSYVKDLSAKYYFGEMQPQEVTFFIDATEALYDVTFTPYGKPGGSVDITISVR